MAINKKDLEKFKKNLLNEKIRIEKELGFFAKPTEKRGEFETQFDNIGSDTEDNASEVEEYADNLALENSLEKQLGEINEAMDEIEEETYGKCKKCGQEIDWDRLNVYPAARNCVKCE